MVLSSDAEVPAGLCGAVGDRPARRRCDAGHPPADDTGAQSLEFALVLPAVMLLLVVVLQTAAVGVDAVRAHHLARDAARAAVLGAPLPGSGEVSVTGPDRSGLVTARVRVRSASLSRLLGDVWIPAEATMVAEP